MIQGECPVCRRLFKVDDRFAGMTGRCKACGSAIHVPGQLDEGLDGLPAVTAPREPSVQAQARPQAEPRPQSRPEQQPQAESVPGTQAVAPSATQSDPPASHPADELGRPHDVRSRYEPSHGPTTLEGSWLKRPAKGEVEQGTAEPAAVEPPEPIPSPVRVMLADRVITAPEPEPSPTERRPLLVSLVVVALIILGGGFAVHLSSAGLSGQFAAGLGVALAALGVVRLWQARWDGLLAAVLLCLCVGGSGLLPSAAPLARDVLVVGAGSALALLLLVALRRGGRDYFTS